MATTATSIISSIITVRAYEFVFRLVRNGGVVKWSSGLASRKQKVEVTPGQHQPQLQIGVKLLYSTIQKDKTTKAVDHLKYSKHKSTSNAQGCITH